MGKIVPYSFCCLDRCLDSREFHHVLAQCFGNVSALLALPVRRRPNRIDSMNSPRPAANDKMELKMVNPAASKWERINYVF